MSRYAFKKQYSWNNDISYLTGLIAADGCLINNRRHLNLTSKDKELINLTQSILNMNVKVAIKKSGYGSVGYHLQFSNVSLYDFFLSAGLTPAKSLTIGKISVPDKYYADFLRGYFDGDGSVHGFWDTRWINSLMYYTEFASASNEFLSWLRSQNSRLVKTSEGRIKHSRGANAASYAKADSRLLFKFMYYDTKVPMLTRKYIKFVQFLETDPYIDIIG